MLGDRKLLRPGTMAYHTHVQGAILEAAAPLDNVKRAE